MNACTTSPLFRPEALAARQDRLSGSVLLRQPVRFFVLGTVTLVATVAIVALIVWGDYTRRQTAIGQIAPNTGIVKVYVKQGSMLEELFIQEGQQVAAGAVLARLSSKRNRAEGADAEAQLAEQLRTGLAALEQMLAQEEKSGGLEGERLARRLEAARQDMQRLRTTLATEDERLRLIETRTADAERLWQARHISGVQYQDQYQSLLEARLHREGTLRIVGGKADEIQDLELQHRQWPAKLAVNLADLRRRLTDARQRLIDIESQRESVIVAPVAGRITALQVKPGQWLAPQLPLLTIVPEQIEFEAELFVPTRAIGFIESGQRVYLRYQAFPYQRYGLYEGRVTQVAHSVLTPQEIPTPVPLEKEPVYRVIVQLEEQNVQAYGKHFPLQAGMLVEADIVLDRRPLWQWLLVPGLSLHGRFGYSKP